MNSSRLGLIWISTAILFFSCAKQEDFSALVPQTVKEDASLPRFTLSDGTLLHLETFGNPDSTVLIVLHGGPGGDYQGLKSLQALCNHYFVVFFDQRGTGLSERLAEDKLTPPFLINDISEIKHYFSPLKPVYMLGHSWGGALATYYVQQYPADVSKLLLAEPGALYKEAAKVANTTAFVFSADGLHQMFNSNTYLSFDNDNIADYKMAVFVNSDVGDYRDYATPDELRMLKFIRCGFLAGYVINEWQGNFDKSYSFDFATGIKENYTGKTLILASDKSQRLGFDFQNQYHKSKFNDCQLIKIENAGHYFIELNSDIALPIIDNFFQH
jgi:proline iminopeptidase